MLGAPPRFVARHLAHPRGFFGWFVGKLMNRHNRRLNAFAVQLLSLKRSERVLEVGFGGGVAIPALLARAGYVAAVDQSLRMVEDASVRFCYALDSHRMTVQVADVESLPFPDKGFHKACTVNTVYFWKSLEPAFQEIRRTLVVGGKLAVGFLPRDAMVRMGFPLDIFTPRGPEEVVGALKNAGFRTALVMKLDEKSAWCVVLAEA